MSDANKETSRRFYEQIDASKGVLPVDLLDASFQVYMSGASEPMDLQAFAQFGGAFYAAFPDLHHHIEEQIAEGDRVAVRVTATGTHRAPFQGIPATGKSINVAVMAIQRFAEGRLIEHRVMFDAMGLMQQLGVVPAPEQ